MSDLQYAEQQELTITGVPASPGVATGTAYLHQRRSPVIESVHIDEHLIPEHIALFEKAKKKLKERWEKLKKQESSDESRAILSAQIEIISDPELSNQVHLYIKKERHSAQHAIDKAFTNYINILSQSSSATMKSRMIDLSDIRDRLVELTGDDKGGGSHKEGDILIAKEISPREVIQLSHQKVKGFVMENGGQTSHAAIIARSMGIPAVVGAKGMIDAISGNPVVYLNGDNGLVTIHPSAETRERVESLNAGRIRSQEEKKEICAKPSHTADGHPFTIQANIEFPEELSHVEQYCAEGVGLLRTESVYLDTEDFCDAEKQQRIYREVMNKTGGEPVTIRLFDVGGDKFQGGAVKESNPFLGWRGIRMLLDEREVLREQLRAILTISAEFPGRLQILIPMVSSFDEIDEVKKEIEACRRRLVENGIEADADIPLGMMVEIPSAAIQAPYFAQKVDFFSIGTNDLTQYLLAVDRGNARLSGRYDQRHPVLWKVINHIVKSAKKEDVNVEVCGELASYPVAAACLLGMGVSTLSMSPIGIPQVKEMLTENKHEEMTLLANRVLGCERLDEVHALFNGWRDT